MARGQKALKRLTETEARELIEEMRWANGKACPHCGNCDQERIVELKSKKSNQVRAGLYRCMECRKQFTVTVGTIFERSKIPLADWVYGFAAMCASKKGISAHQLHRELGITYKTAWFMAHRIRYAMETADLSKLTGIVTADETAVAASLVTPAK